MKIEWEISHTKKATIFSTTWMHDYESWEIIYDWCNQNFDAQNWDFWYDVLSGVSKHQLIKCFFEFRNDEDILAFRLKWC